MEKIKLFLDMDSTLVDSIKAFCKSYDDTHNTITDYTKVENYNMYPILNLSQQEILDGFEDEKFFNNLKFFDGVEDVLRKFEPCYDIYIITIGTARNLYKKLLWLQQNATFEIKDFCGINNFIKNKSNPLRMDKGIIDMSDGVFIDDHIHNIESNKTAKTKILYQGNPNNKWSQSTIETGEDYIITNWTNGKIDEILYGNIGAFTYNNMYGK